MYLSGFILHCCQSPETEAGKQPSISAYLDKDGKRFVPFADQTVKLDYRILEQVLVETSPGRQIFVNYIEAHPRASLTPGEYTFIGNNVVETATFRFARSVS